MNELKWYENIKLLRERMNLSQKDLSERLGISNRTLQRYESGESEPTISVLIKLSQLYDVSIDEIVGNYTTKTINILEIKNSIAAIENQCNAIRNTVGYIENINIIEEKKHINDMLLIFLNR